MRLTVELQPVARSAVKARREVAGTLAGWGHPVEAEIAVLLTSEVVANAVRHAGPHADGETLRLVLEQVGDLVRIEVTDNCGSPDQSVGRSRSRLTTG